MKDETLLLFYEAVRQQVILDGNNEHRFAGMRVPPKYDGICFVHLNGVSNAQAHGTE